MSSIRKEQFDHPLQTNLKEYGLDPRDWVLHCTQTIAEGGLLDKRLGSRKTQDLTSTKTYHFKIINLHESDFYLFGLARERDSRWKWIDIQWNQ